MSAGQPTLADHRLLTALGSLASAVSNEMSNPLAFMLSNLAYACEELGRLSQALREGAGGLAWELNEVREALSETAEGAHRLEHLLKELRKLVGPRRGCSPRGNSRPSAPPPHRRCSTPGNSRPSAPPPHRQ